MKGARKKRRKYDRLDRAAIRIKLLGTFQRRGALATSLGVTASFTAIFPRSRI
jgi:hypothetical protein